MKSVHRITGVALGFLAFWLAYPACAQDPLSDYEADAETGSAWSWTWDVLLRSDRVSGLVGEREVEDVQLRQWLGLHWQNGSLRWDGVIGAAVSTGDNREDRINNRNARSDSIHLDTFALTWLAGENTELTVGKHALPLTLSPAVWDQELRPLGLSLTHVFDLSERWRWHWRGGYYNGNHLYEDESRVLALQTALHLGEGESSNGFVALAYLDFDELQQLTRNGLARQNRRVGTRLISDYRLLDVHAGWQFQVADKPLDLRLDWVKNLGADDLDRAYRASVVWGSAAQTGLELGLSYQRLERDAVMAAFNADEWWFHADAKGYMPWIAYGFNEHWSLQVSRFLEQRLSGGGTVGRTLIDVRGRF